MALRFMDSFEVYGTAETQLYEKWTGYIANIGDGYIENTSGIGGSPGARTGTGYLAVANNGIFKTIDNQGTWIVGAAFNFPSFEDGGGITIRNNGNIAIAWVQQPDGRIQVGFGAGGSGTATSAVAINVNAWNYVELYTVLGTSGTAILHINGQTAISTTGFNITSFTSADVINVVGGGGNQEVYVDDLYVYDGSGTDSYGYSSTCTGFAGDVHIGTLTASADTATIQWVPSSAGAHFSLINTQPPSVDVTYVQSTMTGSTSSGPTDIYKFTSPPAAAGIILGAQSNIFARKTDVANRAVVVVTTNAQGSSTGNDLYLNLDYIDYLNQFDVNPNSGSAWTPAAISTTSWGVQVVI